MTRFLLHLAESEKNLLREIKKRLQHYCKFIKAFNISAAGLVTSYQCLWSVANDIFEDTEYTDSLPEEENDKRERESFLSVFLSLWERSKNERSLLVTDNLQQATTFFAAKEW